MDAVTASPQTPKQNQILAALPAADYKRLLPALELMELPLGHVLYESDVRMTHAYFPIAGIISMLYVMQSGASAEIAIVGNEGMIGVSLFMGGESTSSRSVVLAPVEIICAIARRHCAVTHKRAACPGLDYLRFFFRTIFSTVSRSIL